MTTPYNLIRNFLWNIRDSFRFSIRNIYKATQMLLDTRKLSDDLLIEHILYAIPTSNIKRPHIKTIDETINELINSNKSLVRFGDGEIALMNGFDLYYQNYDKRLAMRMQEILANKQDNLCVAIWNLFCPPSPI